MSSGTFHCLIALDLAFFSLNSTWGVTHLNYYRIKLFKGVHSKFTFTWDKAANAYIGSERIWNDHSHNIRADIICSEMPVKKASGPCEQKHSTMKCVWSIFCSSQKGGHIINVLMRLRGSDARAAHCISSQDAFHPPHQSVNKID